MGQSPKKFLISSLSACKACFMRVVFMVIIRICYFAITWINDKRRKSCLNEILSQNYLASQFTRGEIPAQTGKVVCLIFISFMRESCVKNTTMKAHLTIQFVKLLFPCILNSVCYCRKKLSQTMSKSSKPIVRSNKVYQKL